MPPTTHTHKPPHIGRASELYGSDRVLYRLLEILPGFLAWTTILGAIFLSYFNPIYAAIFIIIFDFYWLLKTVYLSIYLRHNWRRMKHNMKLDWSTMLANTKYEHVIHLVIMPFYKESFEVVEKSLLAILDTKYDMKKVAFVLAAEERVGEEAQETARIIEKKYASRFGYFLITTHPKDLPGEMAGKGSNIAYSAEQARIKILDANKINYEHVLVSAFDTDTVVYPQYFLCITWHFLTAEKPFRVSYQPVPLYNNNMWEAPALSRVVAASGTFWQMIQQERPEKLATFSSHAVSFKALYEIGYWQKNMVSEDSRIFWNAFIAYDGNYSVMPISYPVSMDANLAPTFWQTIKNIYKQQRRWGWGVENLPYIIFCMIKNPRIKLQKKISVAFIQLEGYWSLATNPLLIFLLGWLPLILGGGRFNTTILSYNLPVVTRNLMILAMMGLVMSAIISMSFLPPAPKGHGHLKKSFHILQWVFIPLTITIFGSIPGLEAQTRLMLGKYMGFWVTPKFQKEK
ncbi:glycosyltransferase family 2 protein [Candidatus Parcubacteria bacterium]|nr:glycosyltransferase family 2 protein [Candidatus Parcubacteria bacterium]